MGWAIFRRQNWWYLLDVTTSDDHGAVVGPFCTEADARGFAAACPAAWVV